MSGARTPAAARLVAVALITGAVVCLGAGAASAHATLVGTDPADGARITSTAPTQVGLTFSENIRTPSKIVVTGPGGTVSRGATSVSDNRVSVRVHIERVPSAVGRYTMAYRVVSADGHPVTGESTFDYRPTGVAAAAPSSPAPAAREAVAPSSPWWPWALGAGVVVLAIAVLLGGRRTGRRAPDDGARP